MIDNAQLQTSDSDGVVYNVNVKDRSAHAWAEIYVPNAGWIPVEFTPGFNEGSNPNLVKKNTDIVTTAPETPKTDVTSPIITTPSTTPTATTIQPNKSASSSSSGIPININILSIVFVLLLLFGSFLFILFRRKIALKRINESINSDSLNKNMINLYKLTLRYLELINISSVKNQSNLKLALELTELCYKKTLKNFNDDFEKLTSLALKADMSNNLITKDEFEFAKIFKDEIASFVYTQLKKLEVLKAKYIENLY